MELKRREKREVAGRFWEKVDQRGPDECWLWTAGRSNGRGVFQLGRGRPVAAHRMALALGRGGEGVLALGPVKARCGNPLCCNPKHLREEEPRWQA